MYYLDPKAEKAHVCFFYRNFMKHNANFCHIGLGVNTLHMVRTLRASHIHADTYGVWEYKDVMGQLAAFPTCTHAVVEAPWITAEQMFEMMTAYPHVHFLCRNHSQIGFLQVEAGAVKMIRDYLHLQEGNLNFNFAANSIRYCQYIEQTYNGRCIYLPNLYWFERPARHEGKIHTGKILRISSFGSLRLLKNHPTTAAAAQIIARQRQCDLEFHVSVNREEHGGGILQMMRNMFHGLPWARLVEVPWATWSEFRHIIANMDLAMQVSFTETFNITTADACAEGVPSVVSQAIEWVPKHWQAHIDDPTDIARVGQVLLSDRTAARNGYDHLRSYVKKGTRAWIDYLNGEYISNNPLDH